MTIFLMVLLLVAMAVVFLNGARFEPTKNTFMSVDDTTFLRGLWCIIVVLVHIPAAYQNKIQDMIGSFAYIGVTFFFMASGYGLKWSAHHKKNYLDRFWIKRLPSLLIPALMANAFFVLFGIINGDSFSLLSFFNINSWVKVLLLHYTLFWIVYKLLAKIIRADWRDIVMCILICCYSLIASLADLKITLGWGVESLGFAYGILAARYNQQIKDWLKEKWSLKSGSLMFVSIILGVMYLKYKHVIFFGDYLLRIALGIAITSFIFTFLGKVRVGNKASTFLGNISYEIYLLHGPAFSLLMAMDTVGINSGLFILASVILTVLFAWGLKIVCKPMIRKIS